MDGGLKKRRQRASELEKEEGRRDAVVNEWRTGSAVVNARLGTLGIGY